MIPRIDSHRHMGGSISSEFVWDVICELDLKHLAETEDEVRAKMQFLPGEKPGFKKFLDKFVILDHLPWTEELIDQSIAAVCIGLADDRIDYTWMRFSVNKYVERMNWTAKEAVKFIYEAFQRHRPDKVALILSLKYESARTSQRQYAAIIDDPDMSEILAGVDLVGDETFFDYEFYGEILAPWRKQERKIICAHVAESQKAENAYQAIKTLGVTEIAHGIKCTQGMLALAKDRQIGFGLALTSNYLTGVWSDVTYHPIRKLMGAGVDCMIGTDDPVQCSTNLNQEFELAWKVGLTDEQCKLLRVTAVERSRRYGLLT